MSLYPAALLELAGGGRLSLSPLPRGLADLRALKADVLLSLTEPEEEARAGVADLAGLCAQAGLLHLRLPIPDYATPPGDLAVLGQALAQLQGGAHLALHCRGGCGRSGMVALILMRRMGEPAEAALARLRAARPCAIETAAQLAFALRD